jgi:hypothetical protein
MVDPKSLGYMNIYVANPEGALLKTICTYFIDNKHWNSSRLIEADILQITNRTIEAFGDQLVIYVW